MTVYATDFNATVVNILINGGVGVLRTDTLYGLVARADDKAAVERIFRLKQRTPSKPPISLISSVDQLFDECDQATLDAVQPFWPGSNTIILPSQKGPEWLTRGSGSVSYRLPAKQSLAELIAKTGPLVAPSANPEGKKPASTIVEAKAYFGDSVDFYVDGGEVTDDTPSRLYRLQGEEFERLR